MIAATLFLGFTRSGTAVGGATFRPTAVTESDAAATVQSRDSVRPCPYARLGVVFYRSRFVYWTIKTGSSIPDWRKPRNCADARYLANVWAGRSFKARRAYEKQIEQVVRRLERGLAGTPMEGAGAILERHGRRYGVSPYFIVAAAATESSIGRAACSNNRFNVWGLSSCGSGWYVPAFRSWDEAVAFYARFLSSRWAGHSSPYSFRGYAACDECWGRKVSEWMHSLFGVPAVTRYP